MLVCYLGKLLILLLTVNLFKQCNCSKSTCRFPFRMRIRPRGLLTYLSKFNIHHGNLSTTCNPQMFTLSLKFQQFSAWTYLAERHFRDSLSNKKFIWHEAQKNPTERRRQWIVLSRGNVVPSLSMAARISNKTANWRLFRRFGRVNDQILQNRFYREKLSLVCERPLGKLGDDRGVAVHPKHC